MSNEDEFEVLSARSVFTIVDTGLPLERVNKETDYVHYYEEKSVLPRTNDFKPVEVPSVEELHKKFFVLRMIDTSFLYYDAKSRQELGLEVYRTTKEQELLDPLKGNSLASSPYMDSTLYVFSTGDSMSNLVISYTKHQPFQLRPDYTVPLPLDTLTVIETIDLKYPIKQIAFSPLEHVFPKVFIVRTTSSITVYSLDKEQVVRQVQHLFLAEETLSSPEINYSMPVHVAPSPYFLYEYLFVTNNGYVSMRNAYENTIIFEDIDPVDPAINYLSRWKSCSIASTPRSIYIASYDGIQHWDIKGEVIETKTLTESFDRITAFTISNCRKLFGFATEQRLILFDSQTPTQPIIDYKHNVNRGVPRLINIESFPDDKWRVYVHSHQSQQLSILDFQYLQCPTKNVVPKVKIAKYHDLLLSENQFEITPEIITGAGISFKILDKNSDRELLSIERLFEDGSMRVQYVEIKAEKSSSDVPLKPISTPSFNIVPDERFKDIMEDAALLKLPQYNTHDNVREAEVKTINTTGLTEYLDNQAMLNDSLKLTDEVKTMIANKVRQLNHPVSFGSLFPQNSYSLYDLEDVINFLNQLEKYEDIEIMKKVDIPRIRSFTSMQPIRTEKLRNAHAKKIKLYETIIRPITERGVFSEKTNPFEYLNSDDVKYDSTMTTRILADLWPINENLSYKDIPFPEINPARKVSKEKFPRVRENTAIFKDELEIMSSIPRISVEQSASSSTPQDNSDEYASVPTIKVEHEDLSSQLLQPPNKRRVSFSAISTQPLPGSHGTRVRSTVKKKKKPKTSGFK